MYADVFKRVIDFCLSLLALIVLSPFFLILVLAGTIAMRGNPFFVQPRPGRKGTDGKEIIFYLIKFRTMDNKTDAQGRMLPDEKRRQDVVSAQHRDFDGLAAERIAAVCGLPEALRRLSREVEHDADNGEALLTAFRDDAAFDLGCFLRELRDPE